MIEVSWSLLSDARIRGRTVIRDDFSRELEVRGELVVTDLPGAASTKVFRTRRAWEAWWSKEFAGGSQPVQFQRVAMRASKTSGPERVMPVLTAAQHPDDCEGEGILHRRPIGF